MVEKTEFIWKNGLFVPWNDAVNHELTHALHYGSSVYEGERCYETDRGSAIFRLRDHTDRLYKSAEVLGMDIPFSREELEEATKELVRRNGLSECYIRPIVYRALGPMGLYSLENPVNISISAWPWPSYIGDFARTMISSYRRIPNECVPSHAKIGGMYAALQIAKNEARLAGYDEAILLDIRCKISEGAGENVFIVERNGLKTPSKKSSILLGITRATVIELAEKEFSLPTKELEIDPEELFEARNAILTGTAAEITPIISINRKVLYPDMPDAILGNGDLLHETMAIKGKYLRTIRGKEPKYDHWLTYVNSNIPSVA